VEKVGFSVDEVGGSVEDTPLAESFCFSLPVRVVREVRGRVEISHAFLQRKAGSDGNRGSLR
jgi:hypothetical protein